MVGKNLIEMPERIVPSMTPKGICDIINQIADQITYVSIELNQQCTGGGPIVEGKRTRTYQTVEYIWKNDQINLEQIAETISGKSHTMKLILIRCGDKKSITLTNWEVGIYGFLEFPLIMSMIEGPRPKIEFCPV